MAKHDKNLVLVTGDLGYGVLDDFEQKFPNQFFNAGVTEQSMVSLSAGLSSMGFRVFVYSIGNFSTFRCLEQIRNDVCLMNSSVVIVSVGAGYSYGAQGYTHHVIEDLSIMRVLPNMKLFSPCNSFEVEHLTKYLCSSTGPAYLRLGTTSQTLEEADTNKFDPRKFRIVRGGNQGSILFTGSIGSIAVDAANELQKFGINLSVYSVPFISELDSIHLAEIAKTGLILTIEENCGEGGFGTSIIESLSDSNVFCRTKRFFAMRNDLLEVGDQHYLREWNGLSTQNIINYVRKTLN
jgi:transketolase